MGSGNRAKIFSGCVIPQQVALFMKAADDAGGDLAMLIRKRDAAAERYSALGLDTMHPWERLRFLATQTEGFPLFSWFLKIPLEGWFFGDSGLMPA